MSPLVETPADVIYLHYKFDLPQSVHVNIINAADTEGEYEIDLDTKNCAMGIYIVTTMSNGLLLANEKIAVQQ